MAQQQTQVRDPMADVLGDAFTPAEIDEQHQLSVPRGYDVPAPADAAALFGPMITAQRCQPRNMNMVKQTMKALSNAAGSRYVYSWEVNDRARGGKTIVEGGTIVLANDLAREYGNCSVDVRVRDEGQYWMFYARFTDLQTGYNMTRGFQQRKAQNTGMKDQARALDIIFQIGQSKAIRNVVLNALQTLADYCVEQAKEGLLARVEKNPSAAREWIVAQLGKLRIDKARVEAVYGRAVDKWTVPDMAKIYTELQSIMDGMINAEDMFPVPQQDNKEPEAPKQSSAPPASLPDAADGAAPPPKAATPIGAASGPAGSGTDVARPVMVGVEQIAAHTGAVEEGMPIDFGPLGIFEVVSFDARTIAVKKKQPVLGGGGAAPAAPVAASAPAADTKSRPARKAPTFK